MNISDAFLLRAAAQPDDVAIREVFETLTYGELERASGMIAAELSKAADHLGVVAIYGCRSARLVIAILACARASRTFVVLDDAYPMARIGQMLGIVRPALMLAVDRDVFEIAPEFRENLEAIPVWPLTRQSLQNRLLPSEAPLSKHVDIQNNLENPTAYLLFTSGTTGVPKCIKTGHRPLAHFVKWYSDRFEVEANDCFSMLSGLGHDPIMRDIFVPLSNGAQLCIPNSELIIDPRALFGWFEKSNISMAHATPQLLKILSVGATPGKRLHAMRYFFSGGDALRSSHVKPLYLLAPNCKVVNFYGTTETPQAMAYHVLENCDLEGPIPVGKAIDDVCLHVLGESLNPVAHGETGQIGIETDYLSNGYLNDDSMTKGRFVCLPHKQNANYVYLTGDYGAMRPDGALLIKGRGDDQIKVRGFRVEIGEIIAALESLAGIQAAVVLPKITAQGEVSLLAYVVSPELAALEALPYKAKVLELKVTLSRCIPSYMVPARFIALHELPLLPNGKVDRERLPSPDIPRDDGDVVENLLQPRGQDIANEWKRILGLSHIETHSSFVDLGGDSLSFIQASLAVEQALGWLPPNWQEMPLEKLANEPARNPQQTSQISMAILLRAISITLVVVAHFSTVHVVGTSTLFVIAGLSFGRFQLPNVLRRQHSGPIFTALGRIIFPTLLLIGLRQMFQLDFNPYNLLFIGTFVPPELNEGKNLWFIDVLVQSYLLLALLLTSERVRFFAREHLYALALWAMVASMVMAAIQVNLNLRNMYLTGIAPVKFFWLIFLGIGMASAKKISQKFLLGGLSLGYVWLAWYGYSVAEFSNSFGVYFVVSIALLLFVNEVPLPRVTARLTTTLASASLFIYLTNMTTVRVLDLYVLNEHVWVKVLLTLIVGVTAWWTWDKASNVTNMFWLRWLSRHK